MSSSVYRPRRRLRSEIAPLLLIAAVPGFIAAVFPYEVFSFSPTSTRPAVASCAFVTLTPDEESAAIAAARTAWQVGPEGSRRSRVEMFAQDLEPTVLRSPFTLKDRVRTDLPRAVRPYESALLPPTVASPAPVRLGKPPEGTVQPAFDRAAMLKLDD